MRNLFFAPAVLLLVVSADIAMAQSSQKVSAQASVLATGIVANGSVINGTGIEVQARMNGPERDGLGIFSYGLGYQHTSHTANGVGIRIRGVFFEPRLVLSRFATGTVNPYVSARLGLLRQSNDVGASTAGTSVGLGGGVAYQLNTRTNLDLGVAGLVQSLGTSYATGGRVFIDGTMSSYAVKLGVTVGF